LLYASLFAPNVASRPADLIAGSFSVLGDQRRPGFPVPEPGTLTVLASGLDVLFFIVRRRRRMR